MAIIRIRRRAAGGAAGAPSTLNNAELAYNEQDDTLYYGKGTGGAGGSATTIEIAGGKGAFVSLGTAQTITGAKTFNGTVSGTGFDAAVRVSRLNQMNIPDGPVAMNSQRITGLLDPTSAQDAATKAYVDSVSAGLDPKQSVRVATTANITLSGAQTIDGVSVIAGDRVLVKDQSTGSANGIYICAAGAWTRSTDADTSAEVSPGMFVFIEEGTVNSDSAWVLQTNGPITLSSTALTFVQFSGAGQIVAGNGITKSGNTLSVNQAQLTHDSIGGTLSISKGGTGGTTASDARTNLGLGTIATQAASSVAITGGAIDGTIIGNTTRAAGHFGQVTTRGGIYVQWSGGLEGFMGVAVNQTRISETYSHVVNAANTANVRTWNESWATDKLMQNVLSDTGATENRVYDVTCSSSGATDFRWYIGGILGQKMHLTSSGIQANIGQTSPGLGSFASLTATNMGTGLAKVTSGLFSVATAGTDYLAPSSDIDGGTF